MISYIGIIRMAGKYFLNWLVSPKPDQSPSRNLIIAAFAEPFMGSWKDYYVKSTRVTWQYRYDLLE